MTDETQPQHDHPAAVLVEVEPGLACLFGEDVPEGLEVVYPPLLPKRAVSEISTALGTAVVAANLAGQTAGAAGAFQGLVRLTPETLELMKTYTLVVKDGAYLGILRGPGGKFVAPVGFVPFGTTGVAAGLVARRSRRRPARHPGRARRHHVPGAGEPRTHR